MFSVVVDENVHSFLLSNFLASMSPNIKSALKWNRGVCDIVLNTAVEKVVLKMKAKIEEIVSSSVQTFS